MGAVIALSAIEGDLGRDVDVVDREAGAETDLAGTREDRRKRRRGISSEPRPRKTLKIMRIMETDPYSFAPQPRTRPPTLANDDRSPAAIWSTLTPCIMGIWSETTEMLRTSAHLDVRTVNERLKMNDLPRTWSYSSERPLRA